MFLFLKISGHDASRSAHPGLFASINCSRTPQPGQVAGALGDEKSRSMPAAATTPTCPSPCLLSELCNPLVWPGGCTQRSELAVRWTAQRADRLGAFAAEVNGCGRRRRHTRASKRAQHKSAVPFMTCHLHLLLDLLIYNNCFGLVFLFVSQIRSFARRETGSLCGTWRSGGESPNFKRAADWIFYLDNGPGPSQLTTSNNIYLERRKWGKIQINGMRVSVECRRRPYRWPKTLA